uniref:C2H2-type domain-containing protein n=1 Tax=Salarias fasciatus TaxID=181472 RepID=A0A672FTU3_SALFA
MTSVQALREFISERLTAAAGEIFTAFLQTIVPFEEEIDRQRKLLQISSRLNIKSHRTESPQQHIGEQKSSSSVEQEEHEAPHIKEASVPDGEGDDSHHSERDWSSQRLTAAAVEICTLFEQAIVRSQEEVERQHRLLETMWESEIDLHSPELQQHHDCREEQLFKQETHCCLEQEEPEPPQIKEEPEEPELLHFKEEQEEPEPPQIKEEPEEPELLHFKEEQEEPEPPQIKEEPEEQEEPEPPQVKEEPEEPGLLHLKEEQEDSEPPQIEDQEELGTSQEGEQVLLKFESDSFKVPSIAEQSDLREPEEEPDSEQFLSQDSEVHDGRKYSETVPKKLSQNSVTVTEKKKISCEICWRSFTWQSHLLIHMRTHTGERPYSCQICGKHFAIQSNLVIHMRTHTGEKPYSCQTCGKSFGAQGCLSRHMRTHTGEKPYSCGSCGKSFSTRGHLLVHMRSHTGEKPYSCQTCGKSFNRQTYLSRHMRTHTDEKPYSCQTCGKSFSRQSNLSMHMRTHR